MKGLISPEGTDAPLPDYGLTMTETREHSGETSFPQSRCSLQWVRGFPWPHLASCPASHYSLGRRWVTWWANKSPLSVSWMGGAHLSRISEDSLVSLPHPLFPSQVCSFADCNVLSGWFLWSPAWIWGVNKPTWAVTQKCSSHKGDNSAPSTSRLCLVSETEGRGDINFAPSKPQLTKMRAAMINIIISLFLRQIYQQQKQDFHLHWLIQRRPNTPANGLKIRPCSGN